MPPIERISINTFSSQAAGRRVRLATYFGNRHRLSRITVDFSRCSTPDVRNFISAVRIPNSFQDHVISCALQGIVHATKAMQEMRHLFRPLSQLRMEAFAKVRDNYHSKMFGQDEYGISGESLFDRIVTGTVTSCAKYGLEVHVEDVYRVILSVEGWLIRNFNRNDLSAAMCAQETNIQNKALRGEYRKPDAKTDRKPSAELLGFALQSEHVSHERKVVLALIALSTPHFKRGDHFAYSLALDAKHILPVLNRELEAKGADLIPSYFYDPLKIRSCYQRNLRAAECARLDAEARLVELAALRSKQTEFVGLLRVQEANLTENARLAEEASLAEIARRRPKRTELVSLLRVQETRLTEEARVAEEARLVEIAIRRSKRTELVSFLRVQEAKLIEEARLAEETRLAELARERAEELELQARLETGRSDHRVYLEACLDRSIDLDTRMDLHITWQNKQGLRGEEVTAHRKVAKSLFEEIISDISEGFDIDPDARWSLSKTTWYWKIFRYHRSKTLRFRLDMINDLCEARFYSRPASSAGVLAELVSHPDQRVRQGARLDLKRYIQFGVEFLSPEERTLFQNRLVAAQVLHEIGEEVDVEFIIPELGLKKRPSRWVHGRYIREAAMGLGLDEEEIETFSAYYQRAQRTEYPFGEFVGPLWQFTQSAGVHFAETFETAHALMQILPTNQFRVAGVFRRALEVTPAGASLVGVRSAYPAIPFDSLALCICFVNGMPFDQIMTNFNTVFASKKIRSGRNRKLAIRQVLLKILLSKSKPNMHAVVDLLGFVERGFGKPQQSAFIEALAYIESLSEFGDLITMVEETAGGE
ncbi:MAG: hypothetical protein KKB81_07860 [Candidatus Margulisbacteria bacterium]|nr:hypothetical protein [Candidatus Margulisiibacteriota bacterium]MBU1021791.1 hypothetical protein [Candidatus Margulisiibacteriota bacterium]MBU1729537.1 hypothetical protein [Candidatus Margulisiibacteriota bacterium]MBU1955362.1 hypothetical protein [Candidatus Margulisiibacteriota bacterium]